MSLQDKIKNYFYHRRIHQLLLQRGSQVVLPINQSYDIGVLFHYENVEELQTVLAFSNWLNKRDRTVQILCYCPLKKYQEPGQIHLITPKDVNWLSIPKQKEVFDFCNAKFDLLINMDQKSQKTLEFIASISKAAFKLGLSSSFFQVYDVLLELPMDNASKKIEEIKKLVQYISQ